jgi:anti-sigma B factor antagonist
MPDPRNPGAPGLGIEERKQDERWTLLLSGELDLASAPALAETITRLCRAGASELTLDLTPLAFIDSTGLSVILAGMQLCAEHDCQFWLVPGQPQVQRLFEVVGMSHRLPFRVPDDQPADAAQETRTATAGAIEP